MPKPEANWRRTPHALRWRGLLVSIVGALLLCMLLLHLRRVSALLNSKSAAADPLQRRNAVQGEGTTGARSRQVDSKPPYPKWEAEEEDTTKEHHHETAAAFLRLRNPDMIGSSTSATTTRDAEFLTAEFPASQLLIGGNVSDADRIGTFLRHRAAPAPPQGDGDAEGNRYLGSHASLLLIPVNDGYLEFGLNLMCSLLNVSVRESREPPLVQERAHDAAPPVVIDASLKREGFVFVAMDAAVQEKLHKLRLPVFRDPEIPFITEKSAAWGDPKFHSLVCTKLVPVLRVLRLGLRVILTDADMVFLRNPSPFYRRDVSVVFSIGSCHKDLPDNFHFLPEGIEKLNTGFYVADPTPAVVDLFRRALSICRSASLTGDQPAINQVIQSDWSSRRVRQGDAEHSDESAYRYGFFDGCLFANGCVYFKHLCANTTTYPAYVKRRYEAHGTTHLLKVPRNQPVLVHANFLVGKKDKVKHLRKYGLWNEGCIASWVNRAGLTLRV